MLGAKTNKTPDYKITLQPISKTVQKNDASIVKGLDVETHCKIVGLVARQLISFYPAWLQKKLFPSGSDLIAACHDVGKISPDFQLMIHEFLTSWKKSDYPELSNANSDHAKRKGNSFHAKVSGISLSNILDKKSSYISDIVAKHHGFNPNSFPRTENSYGGESWTQLRHELVTNLINYFTCNDKSWPHIETFVHANVIAGLVTISDWIGSGGIFSTLELGNNPSNVKLEGMAQSAVIDAGFQKISVKPDLSFIDIFNFSPNSVQTELINSISGSGVYILEAPMGIGKTEAALYAAYLLLSQAKATGIYFALPTRLTSEKIFDRVNSFLQKIINTDNKILNARLLHSSAWLSQIIFGEDADTGGSWFDSSKRGILAPFAVGTIDQALMAVMNVTHGFVRTFGLAGKVVILDEVHSYDSYTGTIMNELISCLREIGCTVIILSATLTGKQKLQILKLADSNELSSHYPLITSFPNNSSSLSEFNVENNYSHEVEILHCNDENKAIELIIEKSESGEQVLWIENTVAEAQKIYRFISARTDKGSVECGLIHSRFIKSERNINEEYWVSLYGKDGLNLRKNKGRILIGTQVLEQSIDIDADFLVTRICPTDMLLQRIGRLWRHAIFNKFRPSEAKRQALILAPLYQDALFKEKQFSSSSLIYSEYILCRSLEIWENIDKISLPGNIRHLLENTYKERQEKDRLSKLKAELETARKKLQQQALLGLSTEINTLPESAAQTRYSEIDSINLLLIRFMQKTDDGRTLHFLDGSKLYIPRHTVNAKLKRNIASTLMLNSVRIADYMAPLVDTDISWLKPYIYIGGSDYNESPFRIARVDNSDEIKLINGAIANEKYNLWYNSILGYKAEKKEITSE